MYIRLYIDVIYSDDAENAFKKAEKIYDDVAHMMKYGGLSRKHQDYRYVRDTHERVMEALGNSIGLSQIRNFYRVKTNFQLEVQVQFGI